MTKDDEFSIKPVFIEFRKESGLYPAVYHVVMAYSATDDNATVSDPLRTLEFMQGGEMQKFEIWIPSETYTGHLPDCEGYQPELYKRIKKMRNGTKMEP